MPKKIDAETEKNAAALYLAYPKHVAKAAAVKAIRIALAKETFDRLMEAVTAYAESRVGQDKTFTPHPASWFNQERWEDDRSTWKSNIGRPRGGADDYDEKCVRKTVNDF